MVDAVVVVAAVVVAVVVDVMVVIGGGGGDCGGDLCHGGGHGGGGGYCGGGGLAFSDVTSRARSASSRVEFSNLSLASFKRASRSSGVCSLPPLCFDLKCFVKFLAA